MLILLVSTVLCRTQHDNTTSWISTATHRTEPPWQHIITQIFQMTYCQALDAFSLCKWLKAIKPNKWASCERPFLHEKKYPQGCLWRHKHQTPIKHISTEANRLKIFSQSFLHLWTQVFCFFPCAFLPISLLLSVLFLCCICVISFTLFLHWPIVMPLTPPVWCRFGSVCLWTDSPLSNGANVLLCGQSTVSWKWASNCNFQNKLASSQNQAWTCGCTFLSGGGDARKERRKYRLKRENELRLESEVGG